MVSLLVAAGLAPLQGTPSAPPQLARPFTCEAAFLPLDRFAKLLERRTGLPFEASSSVAGRKIALACVDRPVSEVMRVVGEALFMEWRREGGVYRLRMDDAALAEEAAAIKAANAALARGVASAVDLLAEMSALSEERRNVEAGWAIQEVKRLAPKDGAPLSAAYKAALARKAILTAGVQRGLGSLFVGRVRETASAIAEGRTLIGATERLPGVVPMSPSLAEEISFASEGGAIALVRLARGGEGLMAMGFPISGQAASLGYVDLRPSIAAIREPQRIERRLDRWASGRDESVLRRPVAGRSTPVRPRYGVAALSAGEQLIDLSRRSRVPIVADAFRLPCSPAAPFGGADVQAWLDAFNRPRTIEGHGFEPGRLRTSGGWTMFRTARYWEKLGPEIPESSIERLEGPVGAPRLATLDDYAAFVASLSPSGLLGLERPLLVGFRRRLAADNRLLLRFWSSLSLRQRDLARARGLPVASLDARQTSALGEALVGMAFGGESRKPYLSLLLRLLRGEAAALAGARIALAVSDPSTGGMEPDFEYLASGAQPALVPATPKTTLAILRSGADANVKVEMSLPSRPFGAL